MQDTQKRIDELTESLKFENAVVTDSDEGFIVREIQDFDIYSLHLYSDGKVRYVHLEDYCIIYDMMFNSDEELIQTYNKGRLC